MTDADNFRRLVEMRARVLVRSISGFAERLTATQLELDDLRETCPWAFDDQGEPVEDKSPPRGGRMM